MTGQIRTLQHDRKFGFIRGPGGVDYFFHASAVADSVNFSALAPGDEVDFDEESSTKGPRAGAVRLPAASEM